MRTEIFEIKSKHITVYCAWFKQKEILDISIAYFLKALCLRLTLFRFYLSFGIKFYIKE